MLINRVNAPFRRSASIEAVWALQLKIEQNKNNNKKIVPCEWFRIPPPLWRSFQSLTFTTSLPSTSLSSVMIHVERAVATSEIFKKKLVRIWIWIWEGESEEEEKSVVRSDRKWGIHNVEFRFFSFSIFFQWISNDWKVLTLRSRELLRMWN